MRLSFTLKSVRIITSAMVCAASIGLHAATPTDSITFGDTTSESSHHLVAKSSDIAKGGLGLSERTLLPLDSSPKDGGSITFTLNVDPEKQNYFTVKLWGSDAGAGHGRLILSCDGKQVGYRDQGDIDALDIIVDSPRLPGHFFYTTMPLPFSATHHKQQVSLAIQVIGDIWVYGNNSDNYRHDLKRPSRGIYAAFTETQPYFSTTDSDPQLHPLPSERPPTRPAEKEVLGDLKSEVNSYLDGILRNPKPLDQYRAETVAHAFFIDWSSLYKSQEAVSKVVLSLDELMRSFNRGAETVADPKSVPNGFGPSGWAVAQLADQLQPTLDQQIDDGKGGTVTRREGWSKMLIASRDYWRQHRRSFTNQTMIVDLNIYRANRGIEVLDPADALSEPQGRRYLYEAFGMLPWTGSDVPGRDGTLRPAVIPPNWTPYFVFTPKGLSKELGYVGGYGEILDWAQEIYRSTEVNGANGDPRLHERLAALLHARSFFREPAVDDQGYRAMRLEQVVGWRDHDFPGIITYTAPTRTEGSALAIVAALGDKDAAGYATQMFDDQQFFPEITKSLSDHGSRNMRMLLDVPTDYAAVINLPASAVRLPMTAGGADVAFADEDDGVLALKHGDQLLYVSLYYRAQLGINHLARIHFLSPGDERDATAVIDETFHASGQSYTVPNLPNRPFAATPWDKLPGVTTDQAGEKLPAAVVPPGVTETFGQQNPYVGRALFYSLQYGRYLIGMNASGSQSYPLHTPQGIKEAQDLVSHKTITLNGSINVEPHSTVVLYLPAQ
jgi:hypothetical protein